MKRLDFQWHLTNRCNLRCLHCYQSQFDDDIPKNLVFDIASRLLGELGEKGYTTTLNLTGGEPFLLGEMLFSLLHLLDVSEVVQEVTIITNSLLIDQETIQKLSVYQKLTTLKVSLEGACVETNDAIRGKGVFERVVNTLKQLREKSSIKILLMFTLSKRNLSELEAMFALSQKLNLDGLMIERFIPEGRGRAISEALLSSQDWENLTRRVIALSCIDADPLELISYRAFLIKFDQNVELWGAPCNLKEAFCLMPDGTILPCRRFLYPLGNILQEGLFRSIEASALLQKVTEKSFLEGKCKKCPVTNCFGCRALGNALSRNPFAEDIQ
ncbi:MAG: radical SAM protein, partial [Candidatus Caldatribacteriaceae bacterium]